VPRAKSAGERTGMIYPIAHDAVRRLGTLFEIERSINGKPATNRLAVRQELSARLMAEIHVWLVGQRAGLLRNHDFTGASQLHAAPLGCIHALPRGRIGRHHQQRCIPLGPRPGSSAAWTGAAGAPLSSTPSSRLLG
jgi:transposase